MTTARATIARHHRLLLDLLTPTRTTARQDERIVALLDAAMAQLAVETAAVRALSDHGGIDTREHLDAHGRARLALFRMATSPSDSAAISRALDDLRDAFSERPRVLAEALTAHLDASALARLGEEMETSLK
jgi:hypothetical protein